MEDDALWAAFLASALTAAEWTHEAHVRTAFLFASRFPLDEAHLRMRAGIVRMNERHGLVESTARGYFETLTRAWLALVDDARRRSAATTSQELLARCPELQDRGLPLAHYSRERLFSVRARAIYVEPDLAALPEHDAGPPARGEPPRSR
jgi:hypothetical protein